MLIGLKYFNFFFLSQLNFTSFTFLLQPGSVWQDGLCRKCSCEDFDGQYAFSCREEICPDVNDLPEADVSTSINLPIYAHINLLRMIWILYRIFVPNLYIEIPRSVLSTRISIFNYDTGNTLLPSNKLTFILSFFLFRIAIIVLMQ